MSDFLLELGKRPQARRLIRRLGLPIPMPQALKRRSGPTVERPLSGHTVAVRSHVESPLLNSLAHTLAEAGATPLVCGDAAQLKAFTGPGEAFGRPPSLFPDLSGAEGEDDRQAPALEGTKVPTTDALVLDLSWMSRMEELRLLYDFFHPLVGRLNRCGRVLVLGRVPADCDSPTAAACHRALEGFVRSAAKELGRRGATALLVNVGAGAEDRLPGVLRFLLSARSAYISGQVLTVDTTARIELPTGQRNTRQTGWTHPLEGKVALVTGAARGIGAVTAERLAADGAHVVLLDRPADDGPTSQLARRLRGSVLLADVTEEGTPKAIADYLRTHHGGVDIVVHNAGITRDKTLARMSQEKWDQALDVNLGAVIRITESLTDGLLRPGGRIICLSSIAGIAGNMGQTNYAASKAGIIGLVGHLAGALADHGVSVNAVAPGFIETRLTAAIPVAIREVARRLNNLSQGGLPEDVAEAIAFLASPGSAGLSGQVLRVCGGSLVGA